MTDWNKCPGCGVTISGVPAYCPNCGEPWNVKCPGCGETRRFWAANKFCSSCGAPVGERGLTTSKKQRGAVSER
jgi:predicted amidophosphoribosyltransferase